MLKHKYIYAKIVHSRGLSLSVRRAFEERIPPLGRTVGEPVLVIGRSYIGRDDDLYEYVGRAI